MKLQKTVLWAFILAVCIVFTMPINAQTAKQRNYMLVFEISDYSAQVKETIGYFIDKVFQKGDQLIVVTPKRLIGFSPDKLKASKKKLIDDLVKNVKADINTGMASYRTAMEEMRRTVMGLSGDSGGAVGSAKVLLADYKKNRQTLSAIKSGLEERLLKYSKIFRPTKGTQFENHLVMILEKESRPVPDKDTMEAFHNSFNDFGFDAQEVFLEDKVVNQPEINFKKLEAAFKYANTKFHLLYMQNKQIRSRQGMDYVENSNQIYKVFSEVATATGGIKATTSTPSAFFKKVEQLLEGKVEVEVVDEGVK